MRTDAQVRASRENGKLGGVKTPEGKAVSSFNARKHGIFASSFSEQDCQELRSFYEELAAGLGPVGPMEELLVERMAVVYLRSYRCARAEAVYQSAVWEDPPEPAAKDGAVIVAGKSEPVLNFELFERVMPLLWRYDTALTNQFLRMLREFKRLQQMRAGEGIAAPMPGDLFVHGPMNQRGMAPGEPGQGAEGDDAKLQNEPKESAGNGPR